MSRDLPEEAEYSLQKIASQLEIANELKAIEMKMMFPSQDDKIDKILRGEFY